MISFNDTVLCVCFLLWLALLVGAYADVSFSLNLGLRSVGKTEFVHS